MISWSQTPNTAQASNQPQAVVNLSMDLTTTTSDGTTYNRYALTAQERDAIAYAQLKNVLICLDRIPTSKCVNLRMYLQKIVK